MKVRKKLFNLFSNKPFIKEYNYIPFRYIFAIAVTLFEVAAILGIVVLLCRYVPYFYIAAWLTEIACVVRIIASDDNPDYKVPWLLLVLVVPIAGFMLYFLFYSRTLKKKYIRRLREIKSGAYHRDDGALFEQLRLEDETAHAQCRARVCADAVNRQEGLPPGRPSCHAIRV